MTQTTAKFALPYPEGSDPPDGPAQFQALAEAVEDALPVRSRGKSIIAAEQSRTNTAYGELGTPDRVEDIVLPTDGLIVVAFSAMWKASVPSSPALASIFVGSNGLKAIAGDTDVPGAQAATLVSSTASIYNPLSSFALGLISGDDSGTAYTGPVTTGQAVGIAGASSIAGKVGPTSTPVYAGGPCMIFAAAGTYDVSVQFKASSGSVTAKERKLWVWSMDFG